MIKISQNHVDRLLGKPITLFAKFHSKTKIVSFPKPEVIAKKNKNGKEYKRLFKTYPRLEKVLLPEPLDISKFSLLEALNKRESTRNYSPEELSLDSISALLFYSGGINLSKGKRGSKYFYPSAGGRYPLEIYFISINSELIPGIYHYSIKSHALEKIGSRKHLLMEKSFGQEWVQKAHGLIIISAVFNRTTQKYGDRGYRAILQEVGFLGQLIYLLSAVLNIGCCAVAGFVDDRLNKMIDVDGVNESVVGVFSVGNIG